MIELRWLYSSRNDIDRLLQYRIYLPSVDGSGALCVGSFTKWTEWKSVPEITETEEPT